MLSHEEAYLRERENAGLVAMLDELRELVDRQSAGTTGVVESPVPGFHTVRLEKSCGTEHCLERPLFSIILQGSKHMTCGLKENARDFSLRAGNSLLVSIDVPASSAILASRETPFLAAFIHLDKKTLLDLSLRMSETQSGLPAARQDFEKGDFDGAAVDMVDEDLLSCMLRLARLWNKPEQIAVRAPIIAAELHYVLLCGRYGHLLQSLYRRDSQNSAAVQAIALLKQDLANPLRVNELARKVNMSVSSLHRHFKQLTGYSPLQYRKQLRLLEARRLMFTENEQAASAAMSVGYESVTQFNRDYKRMFGEPPHKNIRRLQAV